MTKEQEKEHHIIVWGATGFTGKLVAEYLASYAPKEVRFALAGRSSKKLEKVAASVNELDKTKRFGNKGVPIIIADSADHKSLLAMTEQAKVIISTVGPYAKYGYPLVEACIKGKADYLDITGEPTFIKKLIDIYHDDAVKAGVLIVNSTGFDSLPSDLGTLLITDYFRSLSLDTDSVRYSLLGARGGASGGTIGSLCNMLDTTPAKELKTIMQNPDILSNETIPNGKVWNGTGMYYDKGLKVWQTPFVMEASNLRIVRRSNSLLNYGPHFQYCEGVRSPNLVLALLTTFIMMLGGLLVLFPPVRYLLQKYMPPGTGPSEKVRSTGFFKVKLYGEATKPDGSKLSATADVIGVQDPGYGETSKMISEAALCLALQRSLCAEPGKIGHFKPQTSGIATTATSMGLVLVERLRKAGMTFKLQPE